MNNSFVIIIASLGGVLWLYAVLRERLKNTTGETLFAFLKRVLTNKTAEVVPQTKVSVPESSGGTTTIESLEQELGIEPDHYLCDRIARIKEALDARRDKAPAKKKGGAQ